ASLIVWTASGLFSAIRCARLIATDSTSLLGTTWFSTPRSRSSAALKRRPDSRISMACAYAIWRTSRTRVPPAGTNPWTTSRNWTYSSPRPNAQLPPRYELKPAADAQAAARRNDLLVERDTLQVRGVPGADVELVR